MMNILNITENILGRFSLELLPIYEPVLLITFFTILIMILMLIFLIFYFNIWKIIWNEWFKSVDHKKIGIMYIVLGFIMLIRGFADALMMRLHQSISFGDNMGYFNSHHYDQIFTAHGVIMIFFVAMPFITGIMNYVIPLQIGSRDVAFPLLNNLSFWMNVSGAMLVMTSLFIGEFAKTGWMAYPPLSGIIYSPDVGVDYYIWSLQIAGIGTLLSGINLLVTIIKMRSKGMKMMKMPIFIWTSFCTNILIVASFPILTSVLLMLSLDRYLNFNFFTNDMGGNSMMYINLIWIWGHPEVYILILPLFGVFSEIVSTFSQKRLFGYKSIVYATLSITILSYLVWLHHFFTMGSGSNVNAFFGITTMIISIPTGAKVFNWILTMYKGRIKLEIPMLWTICFIVTFVIGGMTGIILSIPPLDFILHNSLFLVAHFHNVIIGGVLFGSMAAITFWFPKAFGYKLNYFFGKCSLLFWIVGFYLSFLPLYILGIKGVTRRLSHFDDFSLKILFNFAAFGSIIIAFGILFFLIQILVSFLNKHETLVYLGDPWNGRTLEWSIKSPPPYYNFSFIPEIKKLDAWYYMKIIKYKYPRKNFLPIHSPKNTEVGFVISMICAILGFNLVWHMWTMLSIFSFLLIIFIIFKSFNYIDQTNIKPREIYFIENIYLKKWKK